MDELYILNKYTNDILLNLALVWVFFAIYKQRTIIINSNQLSIGIFYLVLLADNWLTHFTKVEHLWYFVAISTVIIPFVIFPNAKIPIQLAIFIGLVALLFWIHSELLVQMAFLTTIILTLTRANIYLLGSAKYQYIGFVFSIISVFVFFKAQQFTFIQLGGNWNKSQYLIYFSICDYIVFTTMLLVIHANFRRLFFN